MDTKERKRPARPAGSKKPAERRPTSRKTATGQSRPVSGRTSPVRRPVEQRVPARQAPLRRSSAQPEQRKKSAPARRPENSRIIYTDPKPFNGRKLLLQLATLVAVVLAVVLGMSIFFKVDLEKATVAGNVKYTVNEVMEASGIRGGSNLLTLSDAQVSGNIKAKLPYVNSVRVGIKLPDTVNIEIKELDVPYAVESQDGSWWLMGADGKIVDTITMSEAKTYTRVLGVHIKDAKVGNAAVACEPEKTEETKPQETTAPAATEETAGEGSKPSGAPPVEPVQITGAEQMQIALTILQNLEKNGIMGTVASVDVTDISAIELWYSTRYQVNLGGVKDLSYKISMLKAAVEQMGEHQSGQLDVSFTTWPNQVGYTPFA